MIASTLASVATSMLVAFYNANTAGSPVNKFADRTTAERRCALLAEELVAEGFNVNQVIHAIRTGQVLARLNAEADKLKQLALDNYELDGGTTTECCDHADRVELIKQHGSAAAAWAAQIRKYETTREIQACYDTGVEESAPEASQPEIPIVGEFVSCPHCGVHLSNGYTTYEDLKSDKNHDVNVKDMTHEYMCLGCGGNFGPALQHAPKTPKASATPATKRPAMAESMALDRTILDTTDNVTYKNAFAVYKAGVVSSAQCDRLSAVLYAAAKAGDRTATVEVNGHVFTLAVK